MCFFLSCDLGLENTLEERVDSALTSISTVIIAWGSIPSSGVHSVLKSQDSSEKTI